MDVAFLDHLFLLPDDSMPPPPPPMLDTAMPPATIDPRLLLKLHRPNPGEASVRTTYNPVRPYLNYLPPDIFQRILPYLPCRAILSLRATCRFCLRSIKAALDTSPTVNRAVNGSLFQTFPSSPIPLARRHVCCFFLSQRPPNNDSNGNVNGAANRAGRLAAACLNQQCGIGVTYSGPAAPPSNRGTAATANATSGPANTTISNNGQDFLYGTNNVPTASTIPTAAAAFYRPHATTSANNGLPPSIDMGPPTTTYRTNTASNAHAASSHNTATNASLLSPSTTPAAPTRPLPPFPSTMPPPPPPPRQAATPHPRRGRPVASFEAAFDYDDYLAETRPTIAAAMADFSSYIEREWGVAIGGVGGVRGNGAGCSSTAGMAIRGQLHGRRRRGEGETRRGEVRRDRAGNAGGREGGGVEKRQRRREGVPSQDGGVVRERGEVAEERETAKRGFRGEWGRFTRETMPG